MAKKQPPRLPFLLTYLGSLPFVLCTLFLIFNQINYNVPFLSFLRLHWANISITYGAVILSFICGVQWGFVMCLYNKNYDKKVIERILVWSVIIALIAWLSILLKTHIVSLTILITCFISQWRLDIKLTKLKIIPDWFGRLRQNVTIVIVTCLGIILYITF